jgi:UDP-N-acetylglucosamine 2-epimerase (non-hydrolysing)
MKKILLVFGTRPEAVKMAPLVKEFQKHPDEFDTKVCVTGQHREMLDSVLNIFDIQPNFDLNIMAPNQDLYDITSKVLLGMRNVLKEATPDIVFVHGDTTTSMAAAISAFYRHIEIAHVEAGLRTYQLLSPWPEEMNRQLTDRICAYCFAPTEAAKYNLLQEKIDTDKIIVTGNTVIDALLMAVNILGTKKEIQEKAEMSIREKGYVIHKEKKYILVTGHRRENFGDSLINICKALKELAMSYPNMDIVYPVHPNPNVQKTVYALLTAVKNISLIAPLDYLPFVHLMQHSHLVLTDSGGVQEEAPSLGKPVLVMRDTTERPEAVEAGTVKLVGTDVESIVDNVNLLLNNSSVYHRMAQTNNPYGDGLACERIVAKIEKNNNKKNG